MNVFEAARNYVFSGSDTLKEAFHEAVATVDLPPQAIAQNIGNMRDQDCNPIIASHKDGEAAARQQRLQTLLTELGGPEMAHIPATVRANIG